MKAIQKRRLLIPKQLSEIARESPLVFRRLGGFHAAAERWEEAIIAYSRALELDQKDKTAIWRLGNCLISSGDKEAYRKHCHEMLKRHAATEDPAVAGGRSRMLYVSRVAGSRPQNTFGVSEACCG